MPASCEFVDGGFSLRKSLMVITLQYVKLYKSININLDGNTMFLGGGFILHIKSMDEISY